MQQWKKNVYLLWIAVFIASACWSMVMPFMPIFLKDELGVTEGVSAWAGVLGAVNSLGMAVMAPIWGALGDRYGRKMMMLRAGVSLCILYTLMSLVTGPYGLLGVRILIGILTGFIPTAIALVGVATPQQHVGQALSLVSTANPTGSILGPMLGGLMADLIGIRMTMVAGAICVGGATLLVFFSVKEQFTPIIRAKGNLLGDLAEVLRDRTFATILVTSMLAMAAMSTLDPVMVPYIKELLGEGSPNWLAGALFSLPGIAFVLAAPLWASKARTWGFAGTLTAGLILGAAVIIPQAFARTAYEFGGLRLSQGLFTASVSPGIAALIAQTLPLSLRGRGFGLNQSANSAGFMLGPLLGGFIGTWAGARWVFVVTGVLFAAAALWARLVLTPRVRDAQEDAA
ncbi:MAG TPA: MFS transporter [Symbiobacteriaceae bacterium]|nr:MFS transporter [Symbiobacteriaceae bacterium]